MYFKGRGLIPSHRHWAYNSKECLCKCSGMAEVGIPKTDWVCISHENED